MHIKSLESMILVLGFITGCGNNCPVVEPCLQQKCEITSSVVSTSSSISTFPVIDAGKTTKNTFPILKAKSGSFIKEGSKNLLFLDIDDGTISAADYSSYIPLEAFIQLYPFNSTDKSLIAIGFGIKETIISLSKPQYDRKTHSFEATINIDFKEQESSFEDVIIEFRECPIISYICAYNPKSACPVDAKSVKSCWSWSTLSCVPCDCKAATLTCNSSNQSCCDKNGGCNPSTLNMYGLTQYCVE